MAIVAGFQGVSRKGEITTLGRGGSDTSAVALGVALRAPRVEFYKDVPGIFDSDPKKNPHAQILPSLSHADALALAKAGAKVLHSRCVELAKNNGVELSVLSFQNPLGAGTIVGFECKRNSCLSYEVDTCLHS